MITRFFSKAKDGGKDSPVDGYFLIEIKWLFSVVLLKFNKGHRDNCHFDWTYAKEIKND